jgi:hypothetical protein
MAAALCTKTFEIASACNTRQAIYIKYMTMKHVCIATVAVDEQ